MKINISSDVSLWQCFEKHSDDKSKTSDDELKYYISNTYYCHKIFSNLETYWIYIFTEKSIEKVFANKENLWTHFPHFVLFRAPFTSFFFAPHYTHFNKYCMYKTVEMERKKVVSRKRKPCIGRLYMQSRSAHKTTRWRGGGDAERDRGVALPSSAIRCFSADATVVDVGFVTRWRAQFPARHSVARAV